MDACLRVLDAAVDHDTVQRTLQACADYVLLETGEPVAETAAAEFFVERPPDLAAERALKLGVFDGDRLVGLVDVARDYPRTGDWYLGLLLLAPGARGHGIGARAVAELDGRARAEGAARILLCVFEENVRALRFWRRLGFEQRRLLPPRRFGAKTHVRVEFARDLYGAVAP